MDTSMAETDDFEDVEIGSMPVGIKVYLDSGRTPNPNSYVKSADDGMGNKALEFNATPRTESNGRNYGALMKSNKYIDNNKLAAYNAKK